MSNPNQIARRAGGLYLILFISGFFTIYVRGSITASGEAQAIRQELLLMEWLFRTQIVAELILALAWFFVAFTLWRLFEQAQKHRAMLFLMLAGVGVAIICANTTFQAGVLLVMGSAITTPGGSDTEADLIYLFLGLFNRGWTIAGIFTGLWLFPLGMCVYASGWFPRWLGIGLMVGCFGYLVPVLTVFLWPQYQSINLPVMSLSGLIEITFGLWLLIRGADTSASGAVDAQ